ncbi:MAG TPA: hypothetical protein VGM73_07060 [Candidatus Didemnitutus sp.]|jgi:hypothetical protein
MSTLAARRCIQHPAREAVAQCPSCHEHFCRECVVEHDGILLCAACLARETIRPEAPRGANWQRVGRLLYLAACVMLAWVAFYSVGSILKAVPAQVHDGTIWEALQP